MYHKIFYYNERKITQFVIFFDAFAIVWMESEESLFGKWYGKRHKLCLT